MNVLKKLVSNKKVGILLENIGEETDVIAESFDMESLKQYIIEHMEDYVVPDDKEATKEKIKKVAIEYTLSFIEKHV